MPRWWRSSTRDAGRGPGPGLAGAEGRARVTQPPGSESGPGQLSPVEWTFDPWADRPVTAGLGALAVLAMWLLIATVGFPVLIAVVLGVVVASPLTPAFVPAACRIEPAGAARRGLLGWARRPWSKVRRIDDVPVGLLLSPYERRHWLDASRALTLPMPRPRRGELTSRVRACWQAGTAREREATRAH